MVLTKKTSGIWIAACAAAAVMLPALAGAQTTVKMVYWPGPESDAMGKVVGYYNERIAPETGVTVDMVLFGRDSHTQRQEAIMAAGSSEVDIFYISSDNVGKYTNYLAPLNPSFAALGMGDDGSQSIFIPSATETLSVDGNVYGLPLDVSNHFLFYRDDLISQLLSDPDWQAKYTALAKEHLGKDLKPKDPKDWNYDDYMATALFFTKEYNPDSPTEYGTALQLKNLIYNVMLWDDVLWAYGGNWFDADGKVSIESLAAKEALGVYDKMIELKLTPPDSGNYEYPETNAALETGKAAIALQWSAAYHELNDPAQSPVAGKIAATHMPGEGHPTMVQSVGIGLNAASKNKDAAIKWMTYLSTEDAMRRYAEAGGIPPVESVLTGLGEQRPELPEVAVDIKEYGYALPVTAHTLAIEQALIEEFSAVWAGIKSEDEALKDAQAALEKIVGG
jgi:multiple sugar transport system substrate-binding protein